MTNLKKELLCKLEEYNLCIREDCSQEDNLKYSKMNPNEIPENVFQSTYGEYIEFYKLSKPNISDDEIKILLQIEQEKHLHSIKYCMIFFVVLAIIGIILGCVGFYNIYSVFQNALSSTSSLY
jgi:hypothetical protein